MNNDLKVLAQVTGYLAKVDGKLVVSKINRMLKNLGYEKLGTADLHDQLQLIEQDEDLVKVFEESATNPETDIETADGLIKDDDDFSTAISPTMVTRELDKSAVRNYRKVQRQGSAQQYLASVIANSIKGVLKELPPVTINSNFVTSQSNKTLVAFVTDWHIGATVDGVNGNNFNLAIAKTRIEEYINILLKEIKAKQPEEVKIIHGGDFVEAVDHRNVNQAFDAQLNATEQLSEASRLFIHLIDSVASTGVKTTVGLVGGNHDRFTSNKKDAIYNDNLAYNVLDMVKLVKETGRWSDNVAVLDNSHDVYSLEFPVYDKTIRVVHGDYLKKGDYKIQTQIKDHPINMLLYGHLHSFKVVQEDINQLSIMAGSLQGNNSYSKQLGTPDSRANQLILQFDKGEQVPLIKPVFFTV